MMSTISTIWLENVGTDADGVSAHLFDDSWEGGDDRAFVLAITGHDLDFEASPGRVEIAIPGALLDKMVAAEIARRDAIRARVEKQAKCPHRWSANARSWEKALGHAPLCPDCLLRAPWWPELEWTEGSIPDAVGALRSVKHRAALPDVRSTLAIVETIQGWWWRVVDSATGAVTLAAPLPADSAEAAKWNGTWAWAHRAGLFA